MRGIEGDGQIARTASTKTHRPEDGLGEGIILLLDPLVAERGGGSYETPSDEEARGE